MFARLTRFGGLGGDGIERYVQLVSDSVLPIVRELPGFSGYLALTDVARAEVVVVTLWASEQQLLDSEERILQLRSEASGKVGATVVSVERFRVALHELDAG